MLSVIIMTHDSEHVIRRTLHAAFRVSDDVHIIDSYSEDNTVDVCLSLGCHVVQREFRSYYDQRNWAIDTLPLKYGWQMHLDADEELEDALIAQISAINFAATPMDGYIIGRKVVFMGRVLKHGSIAKTWHCRIFRNKRGRCEDRKYDNHFVCLGKTGLLKGFVLDHQENSIAEWTARHNYWSSIEADEVAQTQSIEAQYVVKADLSGNLIEKKRYFKSHYYRQPLFFRAIAYFLYRYFLRLGFLDGKEGLIYHVLQGFWFRFLVDVKIYEMLVVKARADSH